MPIPIIADYDHTLIIGTIRPYGGGTRLLVQFGKEHGQTVEAFNEIFGSSGARITGWKTEGGQRLIYTAEILCFSLTRAGATRAAAPLNAILDGG
jgi:hypothetical protein